MKRNRINAYELIKELPSLMKENNWLKEVDDIRFVTCNLFDLSNHTYLNNCSYLYLSNVMDFIVGVDKNNVTLESLGEFKEFVINNIIFNLKMDAIIDLSYIKILWHSRKNLYLYKEMYKCDEEFEFSNLSNNKDMIFSLDVHKFLEYCNNNKKLF